MKADLTVSRDGPLALGGLTLYPLTHQALRDGRKIRLRKKEYELLDFLARNKDRVLNRLTILEYVWNYSAHIATNTLEVHMGALRRKIDSGFEQKLLHTFHGLGYKLSLER